MVLVVGFVVVGLVILIAAGLVIREARRLAQDPPGALFDVEDAYEWVAETLPDDVAATLVPDDVRRIVDFQLELIGGTGVTSPGGLPNGGSPRVVGSGEQVAYICERAAETGEAYLPEQVAGVVDAALVYFTAIGAVGPLAERNVSTFPERRGTSEGPEEGGGPNDEK